MDPPPFFFQMNVCWNPKTEQIYIHLAHPPKPEVKKRLADFGNVHFSWKGKEMEAVFKIGISKWQYHVSPAVFFQVNHFLWQAMLDTVESMLIKSKTIIDLYSGVGFFIPPISQFAQNTIAVESHRFSIDLARKSFPNCQFIKSRAESFNFPDADILVIDPPRSGIPSSVIKNIMKAKYQKIIYISCAPATFARDFKILTDGNYKLEKLELFDLFPQTPHLETISAFIR